MELVVSVIAVTNCSRNICADAYCDAVGMDYWKYLDEQMKPLRKCGKAGCRELIDYAERFCDEHKNDDMKQYNKTRRLYDNEYVSFYSSKAWRDVRYQALLRDGFECQECKRNGYMKAGNIGDHIIPTKEDWSLRLDIDNIQCLCSSCHAVKTAEDVEKYGR